MKKAWRTWIICLCLLCLCGCGRGAAEEPRPRELQILQDRQLPELSREESMAMLRYMNVNRALILDGRLYTLDYDGAYLPVLAVYTLEGGLRRERILAEDCVPEFLCQCEGLLFYRNARHNGALESVDPGSGKQRTVKTGPCDWLHAEGGRLYYCDASGRYCSAAPDGSGETVLLKEPCAFPWPLEDQLLYQRLSDESLRLYRTEDGSDIPLTEQAAQSPVILDGRLYYSSGGTVCSMGLDGLDARRCELPTLARPAELLPAGEGLLLRGVTEDNGPRQFTADPAVLPDSLRYTAERGWQLCDTIGPEGRVDAVYNPDGRLRCFVFTDAEGRETVYIAGRVAG